MNNLMIDIESMGTNPEAPIVAIGAVFFAPQSGKLGARFYVGVDLTSAMGQGAIPDGDTIIWWMKQSPEARSAICSDTALKISDALSELSHFINRYAENTKYLKVWGNGSNFDNVIVRGAFERAGQPCPWQYWNDCDVRTIVLAGKQIGFDPKRDMPFEGVAHNALDDAIHQAKYVSAIFKRLIPANPDVIATDTQLVADKVAAQPGKLRAEPEKCGVISNKCIASAESSRWVLTAGTGNGRANSVICISKVTGHGDTQRVDVVKLVVKVGSLSPVFFAQQIFDEINQGNYKNITVGVDADGVGAAVVSKLEELGVDAVPLHWGREMHSEVPDKKSYANQRAYASLMALEAIKSSRFSCSEDDARKIESQAAEITSYLDINGKKRIPPKRINNFFSNPSKHINEFFTYTSVQFPTYQYEVVHTDHFDAFAMSWLVPLKAELKN